MIPETEQKGEGKEEKQQMSFTVPWEANSLKPSMFNVQEFERKKRKNLELNRRRPTSLEGLECLLDALQFLLNL